MKVAISSNGKTLDSELDPRFGRANYFLIVDTDTMEIKEVKENIQNINLPQGAGIQAGKTVADCGVEAVITGNCGPKAFNVLQAAGIKVVTGVQGSIRQAVEKFKQDALQFSNGPNVQGHWA
ncbi:MAG: NifB/NifX family molybdenum-iron cluster-binding protein [Desulfamplus sp.]|nr:NifB/NifX family molybdenum-iron cluster-binding protein [Desulfamplus sp.]